MEKPTCSDFIKNCFSKDDPLGLCAVTMELYELWGKANEDVKLLIYEKGGHGYGMNKKGLPLDGRVR